MNKNFRIKIKMIFKSIIGIGCFLTAFHSMAAESRSRSTSPKQITVTQVIKNQQAFIAAIQPLIEKRVQYMMRITVQIGLIDRFVQFSSPAIANLFWQKFFHDLGSEKEIDLKFLLEEGATRSDCDLYELLLNDPCNQIIFKRIIGFKYRLNDNFDHVKQVSKACKIPKPTSQKIVASLVNQEIQKYKEAKGAPNLEPFLFLYVKSTPLSEKAKKAVEISGFLQRIS